MEENRSKLEIFILLIIFFLSFLYLQLSYFDLKKNEDLFKNSLLTEMEKNVELI